MLTKSQAATKKVDNTAEKIRAVDTWYWVNYDNISLGGKDYSLAGHEYQVDWLQCDETDQCFKKAAQMGATETNVLKTLHGHIFKKYPQGTLYLFPTNDDVSDFSKARFKPLIDGNPVIKPYVVDTDSANIKKIGDSFLYFRGARETSKIEGLKATSSKLKSIPVDRIVFDEKDEMSPAMVALALERFSHSQVQEQVAISTPTIPGYGIDKDYESSDQRMWFLKCDKCGTETCLELEFPDCLIDVQSGVKRICKKCKNEVKPADGRWIAQYPGRKKVGWWISQLNSIFVNPANILNSFLNPPEGNITEVYNSKLGMAYVEVTNRLSLQDVYAVCGNDVMATTAKRTCVMGADIGKEIHVVIGYPNGKNKYHIIFIGRVTEFSELHNLAQLFNVKCTVLDMEPEIRKAREFRQAENKAGRKTYLCDYAENQKVERKENEDEGIVVVRRTEVCDASHNMIAAFQVELPRRNTEVEQYAREMCNLVKTLVVDEVTGSRKYLYRKLGADHYRHATNYFWLACQDRVVQSLNDPARINKGMMVAPEWSPFDGMRQSL